MIKISESKGLEDVYVLTMGHQENKDSVRKKKKIFFCKKMVRAEDYDFYHLHIFV